MIIHHFNGRVEVLDSVVAFNGLILRDGPSASPQGEEIRFKRPPQAAILSDRIPTAKAKKSDWFQRRMTRKFSVVR